MPRPLRIEYKDAYYHVMNRGKARGKVFHGKAYYEAFMATLSEAHARFGVEILCYCLMGNHYHLLLKTPEANLGRVMRHINGVYAQRHNRLKKIDGSLFRGRYKAICVEEDSYQLQLSRYIHRNPVEAKLVRDLDQFEWSSYKYYVSGTEKPPAWLFQSDIYNQLGFKNKKRERYRAFVEMGVDKEIREFYSKGNIMPCLGSEEFRGWAYSQRVTDDESVSEQEKASFRPSIDEVVKMVAAAFEVKEESICRAKRGEKNIPRWVAMYFCQQVGGVKLVDIASGFGLKRTGSIPTTINKLRVMMEADNQLLKVMGRLKASI